MALIGSIGAVKAAGRMEVAGGKGGDDPEN